MPRFVLGFLLLITFGCVSHRPEQPTSKSAVQIAANVQIAAKEAMVHQASFAEIAGERDETAPPDALNDPQSNEIGDDGATTYIEPILIPEFATVAGSPARSDATLASPAVAQIELNLPTTLAMIAADHPAVGIARWRVQQAYADLSAAEVMWLPSIQAGLGFHRHDGHYQASNGDIVDVNRNSFQFGFGSGATGAGTTPRPGLVAQFHLADAIFQPAIARATAYARGHDAGAVLNAQLRDAGLGYINLVAAHQNIRIVEDSRTRIGGLAKITSDFEQAGEGLRSDSQRTQAELRLLDARVAEAKQNAAIASSRLAQTISLDGPATLVPMDTFLVQVDMVDANDAPSVLVQTGLQMRPELKASQALVAAACEGYQREKYAPLVPSVLLGFSNTGFGGGLGNHLDRVDGRYDLDAALSWQVRNLGLGENAARQRASARIQQAKFEKLRVMDQVAQEITEAAARVKFAAQRIKMTQEAIESSQQSYELNLARIQDGEGLPIEVLQSIQAMESASRAYLSAVSDHNRAQLQLQWALGFPVRS